MCVCVLCFKPLCSWALGSIPRAFPADVMSLFEDPMDCLKRGYVIALFLAVIAITALARWSHGRCPHAIHFGKKQRFIFATFFDPIKLPGGISSRKIFDGQIFFTRNSHQIFPNSFKKIHQIFSARNLSPAKFVGYNPPPVTSSAFCIQISK